ncbi:MAG: PilZ domain-containing protein [Deltaproteobacteria bacterium]|nr:PilZ domain-containing protein [Deltaproteobacteria bacterium]
MTETTKRTKRQALRFVPEQHKIRYRTEFEDGDATILNISSSGCALCETTTRLSLDEKILIVLKLEEDKDPIEVSARVVRTDEQCTAVKFHFISEENRKRTVYFFSNKQRTAQINSQK